MRPQRQCRNLGTLVLADPEYVQLETMLIPLKKKRGKWVPAGEERIPHLNEIRAYTRKTGIFLKPGKLMP